MPTETPESPEWLSKPLAAPGATLAPQPAPEAVTDELARAHGAPEGDSNPAPRTHTPDRVNDDGSTTFTLKRACNGCGERLGDVTDEEMARGINGLPLPDVRKECPTCGPTAPEPRCLPTKTVWGDQFCVGMDCNHEIADGSEYCDHVTEQAVCITHSEIDRDGNFTHAEPWPCQHANTAA